MSTFYGCVQGNRGSVTRGGSRASGFKASAQSYDGSVVTYLSYNDNDELMVEICVSEASSSYGSRIFYGTFQEYVDRLKG